MSVAERHLDSTYAPDDLGFVIEQVGAGNYADALQALSRAKAEDPRNIFLIALEKQVSRLRNGGILPREKSEIVDSLPGLVERARADHRSRTSSQRSASAPETPLPPTGDRKDPRVKLVVEQYFRHADEWVRKRDFEAALKEIERILLIDPENRVAKEYQSRVQQLFRIEHREENDTLPAPLTATSAPGAADVLEAPAERKVGKLVVILSIGIAATVMVIGGVMFLRPTKGQYKVGYMYVSQSQVPTGGEQGVTAVTAAPEEPAAEEVVPEKTPEVKPPEARPTATTKSSSRSAAKEEKVVEPEPAPVETPSAVQPRNTPAPPVPTAIEQRQRSSEETAAPAKFIPVEQPPKIVQLEQPSFSEEQISKGIQGDIVVKVQIDKNGKPLQAKVISSTNPSLDAAVMEAVLRSSFSPGVMSNGPVTTWMTIPLKLK